MMLSDFIPGIDDYTDEEVEDYGVMPNSMYPGYEVFYVVQAGSNEYEPCSTFPCGMVLVKMEYEV